MLSLKYAGVDLDREIQIKKVVYSSYNNFRDILIQESSQQGIELVNKNLLKLYYTDEDGDQITISSDEDIKAFNELKESLTLYLEGFKLSPIKPKQSVDLIVEVNEVHSDEKKVEIQLSDDIQQQKLQQLQSEPQQQPSQESQQQPQLKQEQENQDLNKKGTMKFHPKKEEQVEERVSSQPAQQNFYQVHGEPKKEILSLTKDELNELIKNQVEQQLNSKLPEIVNQAAQQSQLQSSQIFPSQQSILLNQSKIPMKQKAQVMQRITSTLTSAQNDLIKLLSQNQDEESLKKFDQIQAQLFEEMKKIRSHFSGLNPLENSMIINKDDANVIKIEPVYFPKLDVVEFPPIDAANQKPVISQQKPVQQQKPGPQLNPLAPEEQFINQSIKLIQEIYGGDHEKIKRFVIDNKKITNPNEMIMRYEQQFLQK